MNDYTTEHLNKKQCKIADTIVKLARETFGEDSSGGGCRAFYSLDEWRDRGEDYGTESELIVVHDGGDLANFFNWNYQEYEVMEKMRQALEEIGYYAEQCTNWYTAIYKS